MAWLPHFYPPPPQLPTAGGKSKFSPAHANTHTQSLALSHTHTHTSCTQTTSSLIQLFSSGLFFFLSTFFSLPGFIISSVLLLSKQATLLYCNPGGWGLATFHQHLTAYQSTLSAWGKEMWVKALLSPLWLRKPAGCQQTNICKLGLRNVCLLTEGKA